MYDGVAKLAFRAVTVIGAAVVRCAAKLHTALSLSTIFVASTITGKNTTGIHTDLTGFTVIVHCTITRLNAESLITGPSFWAISIRAARGINAEMLDRIADAPQGTVIWKALTAIFTVKADGIAIPAFGTTVGIHTTEIYTTAVITSQTIRTVKVFKTIRHRDTLSTNTNRPVFAIGVRPAVWKQAYTCNTKRAQWAVFIGVAEYLLNTEAFITEKTFRAIERRVTGFSTFAEKVIGTNGPVWTVIIRYTFTEKDAVAFYASLTGITVYIGIAWTPDAEPLDTGLIFKTSVQAAAIFIEGTAELVAYLAHGTIFVYLTLKLFETHTLFTDLVKATFFIL
jgi:hypothetical protein